MLVFVVFFPLFLLLSLLFGSPAALEDAWHLRIIPIQENHTKGRRAQRKGGNKSFEVGMDNMQRSKYLIKIKPRKENKICRKGTTSFHKKIFGAGL